MQLAFYRHIRAYTLFVGLLLSQNCFGNDIAALGAAYIDTLNKGNVNFGIIFNEPYEYDDSKPHYYGSLKYADFEVGVEGFKTSLGVGEHVGHGIDRIGLSYARLHTQDLAGFEAISSQMGMSFKFGYYLGLHNTNNRLLIGIGVGF